MDALDSPLLLETDSLSSTLGRDVSELFLAIEDPATDPFPVQIQSSPTPKNCSHVSGLFLSTWSFAQRKSCHLVVSQVLLE
jgi:hypothetical protein